jgi:4'-phosphopantetheinyl transferase
MYSTRPPEWRLSGDGILLFLFRLSADAAAEGSCRATLTAEELARAGRFAFPELRSRFVVGRGMARRILGRLTGAAAATLRLHDGPQGKPYLPDHPGLGFNLSHAGDLALMAVDAAHPIGVDLEALRAVPDALSIAERFFAPAEREDLSAIAPAARDIAFLRCWTRKEAYVKALGTGLRQPLDGFRVSVGDDARFVSRGAEDDWALTDVSPAPGYVATVCARRDRRVWRAWSVPAGPDGP